MQEQREYFNLYEANALIPKLEYYFSELAKGNSANPDIPARVVEGLDRNADGIVDDVRFVEQKTFYPSLFLVFFNEKRCVCEEVAAA